MKNNIYTNKSVNPKVSNMRIVVLLSLFIYPFIAFGQRYSEEEIKSFAERTNTLVQGVKIEDGLISRGCSSIGRTVIFTYDIVDDNFELPENHKEEIKNSLLDIRSAYFYFSRQIDLNYRYYKKNNLVKSIKIKSTELEGINSNLGDFLSIENHPKAKGVNMKLRVPLGWEVKEGDLPNIVKKFTNRQFSYSILIRDNATFFSRRQIKEWLSVEDNINMFVRESLKISPYIDAELISISASKTVGTYPALEIKVKGKTMVNNVYFPIISKQWLIYYEDKVIVLHGLGDDNMTYKSLENLFNKITDSIIFPEQFY